MSDVYFADKFGNEIDPKGVVLVPADLREKNGMVIRDEKGAQVFYADIYVQLDVRKLSIDSWDKKEIVGSVHGVSFTFECHQAIAIDKAGDETDE